MHVINIVLILMMALLAGCSSNPVVYKPEAVPLSAKDNATVRKLYEHYNAWRGVSYREGGLSKNGVDCSGFVHLAYRDKFNKSIPRTTELLENHGHKISADNLSPGDVIFFKTGWKKRHVGIYLKDGKFMHASSSRGVMISNLDNPYWSDAFWQARRLN